jgi:hypothetical protein
MSTTTYRGAVNSVLRACNEPSVSAGGFATPSGENAARVIQQAKDIVNEVYLELQNDRPDSFWEKSAELRLYQPYTQGAIETIPVAPNNDTITFSDDADLDTVPWITGANPVQNIQDTMLHILGERQYYRVTERTDDKTIVTVNGILDHEGFNDPANPLAYTLFKYRYDLPADFRDVLNVFNPHVGADLQPVGSERMVELISEFAYLQTTAAANTGWGTDPTHYAIQRNDSGVVKLIVHPIVFQDRILTIRYQRQQTVPSAENATFDLDEDLMGILLSRAKGRACMEILRDSEMAAYYHRMERDLKALGVKKSMEQGGQNQRIVPSTGVDYRAFYGQQGQEDYNRRIFLRR